MSENFDETMNLSVRRFAIDFFRAMTDADWQTTSYSKYVPLHCILNARCKIRRFEGSCLESLLSIPTVVAGTSLLMQ